MSMMSGSSAILVLDDGSDEGIVFYGKSIGVNGSSVDAKFIEVHISNIYQREEFRHKSYFSDIALGVIAGCGDYGYELAANYATNYLQEN